MNDEWIDDRAALRETAGMLAAADYLTTAQDVVDFLDKPWKWETERTLWLEGAAPSRTPRRGTCSTNDCSGKKNRTKQPGGSCESRAGPGPNSQVTISTRGCTPCQPP